MMAIEKPHKRDLKIRRGITATVLPHLKFKEKKNSKKLIDKGGIVTLEQQKRTGNPSFQKNELESESSTILR